MIYLFDTYYKDKIDFVAALKAAAWYCAKIANYYEAEIIMPKKEFTSEKSINGYLERQNENHVINIIDWLHANSDSDELFKLLIYNLPTKKDEPMVFDHHDDTCCWALNLSEDQFIGLQQELITNHLPEDLFFESSKVVCVKPGGIMGFLGLTRCYTPKEYENKK